MSNLAEAIELSADETTFAGTYDVSPNPFTDAIELTAAGADLAGTACNISS